MGHATTTCYSCPQTTLKIDVENACLCRITPVQIMSEIAKKNQSFVSRQKVQQETFALKTQVAAEDHRPRH